MRYAFIQQQSAKLPVRTMCQLLNVQPSGYYAWLERPVRDGQQRREELKMQIHTSYQANRQVYGSPRIHQELKAQGITCCRNTVAKLMKQMGLSAVTVKPFRVRTTDSNHGFAVAENLLDQEFEAQRPNQVWLADITYIPTEEGWLYLAGIKDLCTRKIVGWSMAEHLRAELVRDALAMAIGRQCPGSDLIHHSDRGVQYACREFQAALTNHGIVCSMSRKGNCYDNAPMESFWGTLKQELVYRRPFPSRAEARRAIFEYIEIFYNRQRRHSALDYASPEQFERQALKEQAA
jgi:transposase InsO family protein